MTKTREDVMKKLMAPFAKILYEAINVYKSEIDLSSLSEPYKKIVDYHIKQTLMLIIRQTGPLIPPDSSENAKKLFPNVELHKLQWKTQPYVDKGRKNLIHEHRYPVSDLLSKLLSNDITEENVLNTLVEQQVVWITRDENCKLPKCNRVKDEYKDNKIEIINNNDPAGWLD